MACNACRWIVALHFVMWVPGNCAIAARDFNKIEKGKMEMRYKVCVKQQDLICSSGKNSNEAFKYGLNQYVSQ